MPTWPGSLPDIPLVEQFQEQPPNLLLRTEMDAGPAKVRRRATAGVRPMRGLISCTKAQVATLDTFYVTTCVGGSLAFDWTHPRTGAAVSFRFRNPPMYVPDYAESWRVSLDLEAMP